MQQNASNTHTLSTALKSINERQIFTISPTIRDCARCKKHSATDGRETGQEAPKNQSSASLVELLPEASLSAVDRSYVAYVALLHVPPPVILQ